MVSAENENANEEIQEDLQSAIVLNIYNDKDQSKQTTQNGSMNETNPLKKFLDMGHIFSRRFEYKKFTSSSTLASPSASFRQMDERDAVSRSVKNSADGDSPKRFHMSFAAKINWSSLKEGSKKWFKNPVNVVLFLWIFFVAVAGAILFMVMTGMLNHVLPKKSQRDVWFEVNNQILNALFTLMCLYQHPRRFHHLALLLRWKPDDVLRLRKIYCKNGSYKPNEWMHMMVVVILLHVNCFAQYALCGLNLGYTRSRRPPIGVGLCISVAIGAPVVATVYNILSPLGKDYETESDQEGQSQTTLVPDTVPAQPGFMSPERKYYFRAKDQVGSAVQKPHWAGGLFDLWDDITLAYLSLFCSFCVFGWNMDRLGFGNMYVHIATFVLLCVAPFWIFNLAAINIDNEVVREALGYTGILLCVFGLLYGGFWRIQMRRRYNLPANNSCCNNPAATDCFQWLCCCFCSLAQETRTIDLYEIEVHKRQGTGAVASEGGVAIVSPLPREDGLPLFRSGPSSPLWINSSPFITTVRSAPSSPLWTSSSPFVTNVSSASPGTFIDTHAIAVRLPVYEGGPSPVMQPPVPSHMQ